jgi:hypothetical protein
MEVTDPSSLECQHPPALHQCGVQVQVVRHDDGANNAHSYCYILRRELWNYQSLKNMTCRWLDVPAARHILTV